MCGLGTLISESRIRYRYTPPRLNIDVALVRTWENEMDMSALSPFFCFFFFVRFQSLCGLVAGSRDLEMVKCFAV